MHTISVHMHTAIEQPASNEVALFQIIGELEKHPESLHRIRFKDCDPFGHLHNARYVDYVMEAREEHLRNHYTLDLQRHAEITGHGWVVRSSQQVFLRPARWNEDVWIQTAILDTTPSGMKVEAVMRSEDRSIVHAAVWMEFSYIDLKRGLPIRHEPEFREFVDSLQIEKGFRLSLPEERIKSFRSRRE